MFVAILLHFLAQSFNDLKPKPHSYPTKQNYKLVNELEAQIVTNF